MSKLTEQQLEALRGMRRNELLSLLRLCEPLDNERCINAVRTHLDQTPPDVWTKEHSMLGGLLAVIDSIGATTSSRVPLRRCLRCGERVRVEGETVLCDGVISKLAPLSVHEPVIIDRLERHDFDAVESLMRERKEKD